MSRACGEFKAKWEKRPDSPGVLTVNGECKLAAVYRVNLVASEEPSDNPEQRRLDLVITLPSGLPPTAVEGQCTLNFSFKEETEVPFSSVLITDVNSDEGETWEVPVRVLTQELAAIRPDGTKWTKMSRPDRV